MIDIENIADEADAIVNGYAFTLIEHHCKVLNLNKPECAALLDEEGNVLETSMDVKEHYLEMYLKWSAYSEKGFKTN